MSMPPRSTRGWRSSRTGNGSAPETSAPSTSDGNLTYVDRVKDSLRRRGENVSSVEVETTVMRHPAVLEAAAVAIPSDLGEDDILVVVTAATGRGPGLRRAAGLLFRPDAVLLRSPVSGSARRHTEERDRAGSQGPSSRKGSRRGRMGPRSTRLHPESLGREKKHDHDISAGVRADGVAGPRTRSSN